MEMVMEMAMEIAICNDMDTVVYAHDTVHKRKGDVIPDIIC